MLKGASSSLFINKDSQRFCWVISTFNVKFKRRVAGCIEHTALTHEALKNAKTHKRSICVSWVDLNNAYGSVRHMQFQFALQRYHVPKPICELMYRYYEGLIGRVHTENWISSCPWQWKQSLSNADHWHSVSLKTDHRVMSARYSCFDPKLQISRDPPCYKYLGRLVKTTECFFANERSAPNIRTFAECSTDGESLPLAWVWGKFSKFSKICLLISIEIAREAKRTKFYENLK